jgi:3-demethylubiquinone-9 3-methyltransferase
MQKIVPFLWFDGKAEEAMNFYVSIFRNSKVLSVTRYGAAGPGPQGTVMSATFQLEGQEFYALNGGPQFRFTPADHRGPNRAAPRARALAASACRLRGGATVTSESSRRATAPEISLTARSNGSWLAADGLPNPLTLRTNWSDAASISSAVTGGSKW